MGRRRFWGWGREGEGPDETQALGIARALAERFGSFARALAAAKSALGPAGILNPGVPI